MLATNRREVESQITALPFVTETPSQIRNKSALEARLREIEEAERAFVRPKVYVRV